MKKTLSLFQRNYDGDRLVRDELVPGAEWVAAGEGVATRKMDGTCCMWRDGTLWKRHELKAGKVAPAGFETAQEPDSVTGDVPGWVPVGDGPDDARHREALAAAGGTLPHGTYELCGPKVQKNPEGYASHVLVRHGSEVLTDCPRTFDALREYLRGRDIEGVVWHHPDGRLVKIKGKDFGLRRGERSGRLTFELTGDRRPQMNEHKREDDAGRLASALSEVLGVETLADMLVFGGFTTRDEADGFGPAQTQTKIAYLAELISMYFAEQRGQAPNASAQPTATAARCDE